MALAIPSYGVQVLGSVRLSGTDSQRGRPEPVARIEAGC